jgi:serine/threonine-protein kinase RsbW
VEESIHKSWVFFADLLNVDQICEEIADCLRAAKQEAHLFPVQMLTREALNNAVIHGSDNDPTLLVRCDLRIEDGLLNLSVEDDGPGFDWLSVLQREVPSSHQVHGRGLRVYELYADLVNFNDQGNAVHLVRDLNRKSTDANDPVDPADEERKI